MKYVVIQKFHKERTLFGDTVILYEVGSYYEAVQCCYKELGMDYDYTIDDELVIRSKKGDVKFIYGDKVIHTKNYDLVIEERDENVCGWNV